MQPAPFPFRFALKQRSVWQREIWRMRASSNPSLFPFVGIGLKSCGQKWQVQALKRTQISHLTASPPSPPYIVLSTFGAIANMSNPISAPVSAAVAQTLALARVSAPKSCQAAYIMPATTTMSIATMGRSDLTLTHSVLTASITLLIPASVSGRASPARRDTARKASASFRIGLLSAAGTHKGGRKIKEEKEKK